MALVVFACVWKNDSRYKKDGSILFKEMLLVSFGIGMKTKNVFQHPAFTC